MLIHYLLECKGESHGDRTDMIQVGTFMITYRYERTVGLGFVLNLMLTTLE